MEKQKSKILDGLGKINQFLFAPHSCMCCGTECEDDYYRLCFRCKEKLDFVTDNFCLKCGAKISRDYDFCIECKDDPHQFELARSVFVYDDTCAQIILKFKYGGAKDFALPLARMLALKYSKSEIIADTVTFVAMPKKREMQRGYNQSFELCKEFSLITGIPMHNLLERTRNVPSQTTLGKTDRKENLKGSLRAVNIDQIMNKEILLIDDVVTTGTTADECAKTLKEAGAKTVFVLSVAKTPAVTVVEDKT